MVIIKKSTITEFADLHPTSKDALNKWYEIAKKADWRNLHDIKANFNSVDYIGNERFVFNIGGNKFRLVAMIFFDKRTVFIRGLFTHIEYNKTDCKNL